MQKMNKIALVIKNAYSYAGTENVCNFMTECFGDKYHIEIFSMEGEGKTFYPYSNVKQIVSFSHEKQPIKKIVKRINDEKFDTVFLISMGRLSVVFAFYSMLTLKRKRAKVYACEHIAINSFNKIIKFMKFMTLRYYDQVVVLTEQDKNVFNRWNIASIHIPNPVKYKNFIRTQRSHQALAVGRLDHQKGFDLLLDIWADFVGKHPDWSLNIAGDGEQREALLAQAAQLKISNSVNFVGKVSNIDDFYRASDMVLMTSRYEGLPLVLLEAKSWSLPVVAYDCPTGPKEIIQHQQDGFLIPMNDKQDFLRNMEKLATDDELFITMSRETQQSAKKFDGGKIKEQWLTLL